MLAMPQKGRSYITKTSKLKTQPILGSYVMRQASPVDLTAQNRVTGSPRQRVMQRS